MSQLIYAPHAIDNKRFYENGDVHEQKAGLLRSNLDIRSGQNCFPFRR